MLAIILSNPTIFAGLCGIMIAALNLAKLIFAARDRASHRAAVIAMSGNHRALEALSHSEPPKGEIQSGPLVMLALCAASALCERPAMSGYPIDGASYVSAADAKPKCGPCEPPARCEGSKCVGNAARPRPPQKRDERLSESPRPLSDYLVRTEEPNWARYLPES